MLLLRTGLTLMLLISTAFAAIGIYHFDDPEQENRFRDLIAELRCPKCQNQNIADSNAPLSADLRQKVYTMMREGHTNEEILTYMVARYGDFITYRPPLNPTTWLLWFGPFVILGMVVLGLSIWVRRRGSAAAGELSEAEQQRLRNLLADSNEDRR